LQGKLLRDYINLVREGKAKFTTHYLPPEAVETMSPDDYYCYPNDSYFYKVEKYKGLTKEECQFSGSDVDE
jgi:hypothetical protein